MNDLGHPDPLSSPQIPPFWQRLPSIARYPLRGGALYALIALSVSTLLGLLPGPVGLLLSVVTWVAVYRYSFEILRDTAQGRMQAPEHGWDVPGGAVTRLLAAALLWIALVLIALLNAGPWAALLVLAGVALLQPGCVISLALDGGLLRALNPAIAMALAARIGWPYLAVAALLLVIQALALAAAWWAPHLPALIGPWAMAAVVIWGVFAAFHLLGYLVYQYHPVLGFIPNAPTALTSTKATDQRLLDEADIAMGEGDPQRALQLLRAAVRGRAVDLTVHVRFRQLLREHGDAAEHHTQTQHYINRLTLEGHERRALAVLREALDQDPRFAPSLPDIATLLVNRAIRGGQLQLACDALYAMTQAWPRAPEAPQWAQQAATLSVQRQHRLSDARHVLELALSHSDDDAQQRELRAALQALLALSPPP